MTATQLKAQLVNLQDRMDGLRELERISFEKKILAQVKLEASEAYNDIIKYDAEIKDVQKAWYSINGEYLKTREKLNILNK